MGSRAASALAHGLSCGGVDTNIMEKQAYGRLEAALEAQELELEFC